MSYKIGIVGKGFVGTAVYENFKNLFQVEVYDIDENKKTKSFSELVEWAEFIFVCVPTPMNHVDGSCDTSIVEQVIRDIAAIRQDKIVVVKSTVVPGTTARLARENNLQICFNPEFLTEANYIQDFKNQDLIIVGADFDDVHKRVVDLYFEFGVNAKSKPMIVTVTTKEAESFKYLANCFLATKVIFANEFKKLCDTIDVDYDTVASLARLDLRLGTTHWSAPGPDGKYGFGGSCFPKDMNALAKFAEENNVSLWLISEALHINKEVRGDD